MKNKIRLIVISFIAMLSIAACSQTDVVGEIAKTSFAKVLEAIPDQIKADEVNGGWSLSAPDDSARFVWSKDYSTSPLHDVMIEFALEPFVLAGLDVNSLPEGIVYENKIMLGITLGADKLEYTTEATPQDSFNQIVKYYREKIGYHEKLDHYGVDLGEGNKFEWAKNIDTNDKDIVFVVDPEIFIQAGMNPDIVEGWTYATVEVKDERGKTIQVKKLLKAFDLQ